MNLEDLGYGDWWRDRLNSPVTEETRLARVIAVDRDRYMIAGHLGVVPAEASGRLLYCTDAVEDLPCVGDWVVVEHVDDGAHAVVHGVLPRKTILRRRAAGGRSAFQPIAANIDVAYVVQSCDVDYNLDRLDRYIVAATDGGIRVKLVLTKCDLLGAVELDRLRAEVKSEHSIEVVAVSSVTGEGYDELTRTLQRCSTYCLLGSSGVGKTTMLNKLLGREEFAVGSVREKSSKGRHTTTRRQLVVLESGALFIDTPGMRELGMMAFGTGMEEGFHDIAAAAEGCRYADCTHTVEKGCAVIARVVSGQLSADRYESYLKLARESRHYEMTMLEKRSKDRAFGKVMKNYQKSSNKRPGEGQI